MADLPAGAQAHHQLAPAADDATSALAPAGEADARAAGSTAAGADSAAPEDNSPSAVAVLAAKRLSETLQQALRGQGEERRLRAVLAAARARAPPSGFDGAVQTAILDLLGELAARRPAEALQLTLELSASLQQQGEQVAAGVVEQNKLVLVGLQRVVAGLEESLVSTLGPLNNARASSHHDALISCCCIRATSLMRLGRLAEAEQPLCEARGAQALSSSGYSSTRDARVVAFSMDLAALLLLQGKPHEAAVLCSETTAALRTAVVEVGDDSVLGEWVLLPYREAAAALRAQAPGQPATLDAISSYARALVVLSKHAEAEPLCREVLEARALLLGPEHPDTHDATHCLADALADTEQAELLYQRAIEGKRRALGGGHPATLSLLRAFAARTTRSCYFSFSKTGATHNPRVGEAVALCREILDGRRAALGSEHTDTLQSMSMLAEALTLQSSNLFWKAPEADRRACLREAGDLYQEAWAARQRLQGAAHDSTLTDLGKHLRSLESQGREDEALALLFRADAVLPRGTLENFASPERGGRLLQRRLLTRFHALPREAAERDTLIGKALAAATQHWTCPTPSVAPGTRTAARRHACSTCWGGGDDGAFLVCPAGCGYELCWACTTLIVNGK